MKKLVDKKYYTVKELADIMKISRIAVFKKVQNKQIKAEKVGKTYIILKDEVEKFIDNDLSERLKMEIEKGVSKVIKEYGETLRLLGRE
ncbi:hypothetical protein A3G56_01360 [Candidatus Falkowbacteria bacterium RIFCSPLOWO2_12_FULL_45_10]|uniref:Helix-turn-helix domain-containing protein n=2 Tax=Candidatus Falkowiibacteriota TaxID=1752728 RepID=A0A1F5RYB4_9BACT|nr:MAG: hypothetical protein A3D54_01160 [Candidatus Falkowbacteria bacterium RIFCSPHIGHO2_02_FULL_45_15]OGF19832.1 MAG: hypothetical protein A3G56_01360 [Candidatus Falkowbacteria bacterium RIFCSPLOWO2_12_FULL_45_10]